MSYYVELNPKRGALYSNYVPESAILLGVIADPHRTGALIQFRLSGVYCRLNDGAATPLDQRLAYQSVREARAFEAQLRSLMLLAPQAE